MKQYHKEHTKYARNFVILYWLFYYNGYFCQHNLVKVDSLLKVTLPYLGDHGGAAILLDIIREKSGGFSMSHVASSVLFLTAAFHLFLEFTK